MSFHKSLTTQYLWRISIVLLVLFISTLINKVNNFIWGKSIHTRTVKIADTTTYKDHTEQFKEMYGHYPVESICDAGYGSEENYLYAQENRIFGGKSEN